MKDIEGTVMQISSIRHGKFAASLKLRWKALSFHLDYRRSFPWSHRIQVVNGGYSNRLMAFTSIVHSPVSHDWSLSISAVIKQLQPQEL